jgi:hypothetical protein
LQCYKVMYLDLRKLHDKSNLLDSGSLGMLAFSC